MDLKIRDTLYYRLAQMLLVMLTVLGAAQVTIVTFQWKKLVDERTQRLNYNLARSLQPYFSAALSPKSRSFWDLTRLKKQMQDFNASADAYVLDSSGKILLDLGRGTADQVRFEVEPINRLLSGGATQPLPIYGATPRYRNRKSVFSAAAITVDGSPAFLYIVLDTWKTHVLFDVLGVNSVVIMSIALFIVTFLITAGIGLLAFFLMTRRFAALTSVMTEFANEDFSRRATVGRKDEIGLLASTANQMADTIVASISTLQHRDQLRRELISNVSHDLRGPVGTIGGCAEQIENSLKACPNPAISEQLHTLQLSAKSLSRLLLELFELSKLEAKETVLHIERFSLEQLLSDICSSQAYKAEKYGVALVLSGDEQLPLVSGDIALLERVLSNLIDNALRHTPQGGSVTLGYERTGDTVRVAVTDTGVGIDAKDVPFIFERFYTGNPNPLAQGTATGLGLAIVKCIIEAHGKSIEVSSELGKGTEFAFHLDLAS